MSEDTLRALLSMVVASPVAAAIVWGVRTVVRAVVEALGRISATQDKILERLDALGKQQDEGRDAAVEVVVTRIVDRLDLDARLRRIEAAARGGAVEVPRSRGPQSRG